MDWPMILAIARAVWRQTLQPQLRYALPSLPVPERNAACPCGSGRKYKQCCLALEREVPTGGANFLPILLEGLPRKRWGELAGSRVALDLVIDTAMGMHEEHRDKDVCSLVEPWFVDDADFQGRRGALFDLLLDAYTELGRPRKKAKLLDRAATVGDRTIRSASLQRKSTMLSDEGGDPGAWQAFGEAQQADPQSPSASQLEVILLLSEGREQEARARATFWAHRLGAMRDPELDDLIASLREVATHGEQALSGQVLTRDPALRELLELLKSAPPVASEYVLDCTDTETGPLKPKPALNKWLRVWAELAPTLARSPAFADDAFDADELDGWLPLLRQHPRLWNAFEVLDTLAASIRARGMTLLTEPLWGPVLERAEQLLREVLRDNHAEGKRLEWGWMENRPALSLLGDRIAIDIDNVARLEWLVLTLNPNDNQGFRDELMRAYLQGGRVNDALALSDSYPDDFGSMRYNHVLALFAAGERGAGADRLA